MLRKKSAADNVQRMVLGPNKVIVPRVVRRSGVLKPCSSVIIPDRHIIGEMKRRTFF
jgi:hypothetical protein